VFVASELGSQTQSLLDDAIPFIRSGDRYVQYHPMEVLAVCCAGERAGEFAHVVRALESNDDVLRVLAMRLMANADATGLEGARRSFETPDSWHRTHEQALLALGQGDRVEPTSVAAMIHDMDPLGTAVRSDCGQAARSSLPNLMTEVGSSDDPDLRNFCGAVSVQRAALASTFGRFSRAGRVGDWVDQAGQGGREVKWYCLIDCDNTVDDPLVTDCDDLKGHDDWDFCEGKLIEPWDGSAWLKATEPEDHGTPDDVLQNHLGLPVFSARLRRVLEQAGVGGIQYLPLQVFRPDGSKVEGYSIANLLNVVPALDRERSDFDVFPAEEPFLDRAGQVEGIRKAVLLADAIAGYDIFRLQEYPLTSYASERFKNLFLVSGFTGFGFREVKVSRATDAKTRSARVGQRRGPKKGSRPRGASATKAPLAGNHEEKRIPASEDTLPRIETDEDFRNLDEAMVWYWQESGMVPILAAALHQVGSPTTRESWQALPDDAKREWRGILQQYMVQRSGTAPGGRQ